MMSERFRKKRTSFGEISYALKFMIIVKKKLFISQICRIIYNLSLLELDLFYHYLFYDKLSILFVTIVTANSFSATFLIDIKTPEVLSSTYGKNNI